MSVAEQTAYIPLGGGVKAHPGLEPLLVDISTITPHPANPRNGDTDAIGESIRVNGVYRPVYVQRSTSRVLAGNHTYAALMELGAERIPVVWIDADDQAAARIMVADNRIADLGRYDDALLYQVLADLAASPPALLGTGYTPEDVAEMAAIIAQADSFAPIDLSGVSRLDHTADKECPYCGAKWRDTANGPERL